MNKKILNFIFNYLLKAFSFTERCAIKTKAWLLTPVPRWRTIVATVAFIAIMTVSLLYGGAKISAATYTWTQTSWATLTSNTTGHPAPANWTEYSAKDTNLVTVNSGADLQLQSAPTVNEYTIGALTNLTPTVSTVTDNSNGTWTIALNATVLSRIFKNDKFTDSAAKSWKILSSFDSADKIIVWDSQGNGGAPATGAATVGRWYSTLQAWETARQGDLVTRGAIERGLVYNDGNFTASVYIDGSTTNANYYMWLTVTPTERHRGVANTGVKIDMGNSGIAIDIRDDYTVVEGFDITNFNDATYGAVVLVNATNITLRNNIIHNGTGPGIKDASTSGGHNAMNNIVYATTGNGIELYGSAYNNTVYNTGATGIVRVTTLTATNNISMSNTTASFGAGITQSYNISSDTTAVGAGSLTSQTLAQVSFVSTTTGSENLHLEFNSVAKNAGADLSLTFTTDIDNDTRSVTWDIGADDIGATLVKVHSIGTAARNFSTLQNWESARDGVLTTRNVFKITTQSGAFTEGETITGTSGATGTYIKEQDTPSISETYMTVDKGNATAFAAGDTLTGGTSLSTATLSTILTTVGAIERGEAYNDSTFTAGVTIDGSTTDATHYMWLTAEPRSRHRGVAGTGVKIDLGAIEANVIAINDPNTIAEWLEITNWKGNSTSGLTKAGITANFTSGNQTIIRNNIIHDPTQGYFRVYGIAIGNSSETGVITAYNNIVYNFLGMTIYGQGIYVSGSGNQYSEIHNNIVYKGSGNYITGIQLNGKLYLRNNISMSMGPDFSFGGGGTIISNNISSDATADDGGGTGHLISQTSAQVAFVSTTAGIEDFHILPASVAKDAGTSLSSTFTTDIDDGQSRPVGSAWDIGADEYYPVYQYPASQTLTSSAYDSTDAANVIGALSWAEDAALPTGTTVTVSLRAATSTASISSASWSDFTNATANCTKSTGTVTCPIAAIPAGLKDGTGDQVFQYKVTLGSTGTNTPTFSNITLQYVVNAPPDFNPTNGLVVSQISDSADANWGKVRIDYSVRDVDTSSAGNIDPGYVTPSFQYNIGGGLVTINSLKLSADATLHKAVNGSTYTTYTAYWDAQTDIANNYLTTAQIKVTVNDLEAANNTASSTSSNFTLDTKVPTVSAFKIDSTLDQLTLTSADDSVLQYRISNNIALSADGLNGTSGAWQSPAVNSISLTPSWIFTGAPSYETAYLQVRDVLGNVSSATAVAPSTPANMYIQDISNIGATTYKEFISWDVFVPTASSAFSSYQVYRSTDGSSYSLLATVSGISTNYYVDSAVSLNATYYYKVRVADTDTDIGNYGAVVTDKVDGQGGSDTTAPNITSVTVTEQQATYATVTWTTDELSNSEVGYSISPSTAFGTLAPVSSFVTSHSVTITNLTPNTTYRFRVKSTDVLGNVATNNNGGAGFTIVTIGGPIISNVTETEVNEHSATIFWNTNTNSNSFVSYSISSSLASPTRSGSASLVGGPPYQHKVSISGLTAGTKYYYFVESTDASSNNSKDTNGNSYYSFTTTSDSKAPIISAVSVPVSALTAAVVVWNTDEVATGIVDYGVTSGVYSSSTTLNSALTIFHIGSLSSLAENTKYYYRVRSTDNAGNEATSAEYNFTTDLTHVVISGGGGGISSVPPIVLDTTPPVITNIKTKDIKSFSATVSFDTSEDSVGFVNYGTDSANLNLTSGDSVYSQNHQVKLSGLMMGKKYSFIVKAVDKSGNIATSTIDSLTTTFFTESSIQLKDTEAFLKEIEDAIESALPSLVPPFIEKPQIINITDNSATATWRTNVKSYGSVSYADDSTYDEKRENPYTTEIADTLNKVVEHKIDLPNLKPDTRYHIMARSFSLPEVVGKSKDLTFITEALKINANIGNVTNNSFKAVWTTSEPTTSVVEYRNMKTGELNQKSSDTKTTAHEILVNNLTPGTSYSVNVFGYNEKGNKISITSSIIIKTSIDTTAPTITSLMIDSALIPGRDDRVQTIVSWKTDEPSTSAVFFKEGVSSPLEKLTNKVEMTNNFVIDHAVVVSSLKPGGLYSIQVSSTDAAGNTALFPIRTALVPEQSQSIVEIIFKNFEDTFRFLRQ